VNRRPIAARKLAVVQALADGLARARVPANAISLFGLACGVGSGVALAATAGTGSWALWLGGGALVQLRLLANMLDGMVAERSAARSHRGELYNELPDRLSDAATLVGLGYAAGGAGLDRPAPVRRSRPAGARARPDRAARGHDGVAAPAAHRRRPRSPPWPWMTGA
jgi:hypothetical protein